MKISDLEFVLVQINRTDCQPPVRTVLTRLSTDEGLDGWGEAPLPWRAEELSGRRDALLPLLAGRSIFDIEELLTLRGLRDPALRCALEMASWDLVGLVAGQPLCHLFGGDYRRRIPIAARLPDASPEALSLAARELLAQGFACQIISAQGNPQQDAQAVRAVREHLGQRVQLRLDAAQRYTPDLARAVCNELEGDGLALVVDPAHAASFSQVAALARQTRIPLAQWRAIATPSDVLTVIRYGAVPFVVIDIHRVGGLIAARKCAAVAHAGGLGAILALQPSLGVASAAMLHLAASVPAFSNCNELSYHQLHDDVLSEPLSSAHGLMSPPESPGLGVRIDRARLERYQVPAP